MLVTTPWTPVHRHTNVRFYRPPWSLHPSTPPTHVPFGQPAPSLGVFPPLRLLSIPKRLDLDRREPRMVRSRHPPLPTFTPRAKRYFSVYRCLHPEGTFQISHRLLDMEGATSGCDNCLFWSFCHTPAHDLSLTPSLLPTSRSLSTFSRSVLPL